MRINNRKRLFFLLALIAGLCFGACAASPELKLARQAEMTGNLEDAHRYYMQVLQSDSGNSEALKAIGKIRADLTGRARREAAAMLQNAPAVTAPLLRNCIARLDQAGEYDPQGTYLGTDRNDYAQRLKELEEAVRLRVNQMTLAISAGDFSQASALMDAIKETDSGYPDIEAIEAAYKKSYGVFLEKQIMAAYADDREKDADAALNEWMRLGFSKNERKRLQLSIKNQEIKTLQHKCRRMMDTHQYYTAFLTLLKSRYKDELAYEISALRLKGASFYTGQARLRMAGGNAARAYLETVKGLELNPEFPGLADLHRDAGDRVSRMIQKFFAIPTFESPEAYPDAGLQFSDALIHYLYQVLPGGISIMDREKIDSLMAAHPQELAELATLFNVDVIVTGKVVRLTVERMANSETEAFPRADNGKSTEEAPPKTTGQTESGTNAPNPGGSRVRGEAAVEVSIFDAGKGRTLYAKLLKANYDVADDDGSNQAETGGAPIALPSDAEVLENLQHQIVIHVADVIQAQFKKRESEFLQTAREYLRQGETGPAISELAKGFFFCIQAEVAIDNPAFIEIRNKMVALTETDFL